MREHGATASLAAVGVLAAAFVASLMWNRMRTSKERR
jgi:hypothetical protein